VPAGAPSAGLAARGAAGAVAAEAVSGRLVAVARVSAGRGAVATPAVRPARVGPVRPAGPPLRSVTTRPGQVAGSRPCALLPRANSAVRLVAPRPRSVTPVVVGTVVVRHLCSSPMVGGRESRPPEQ
jgi:hypothetical protein